ncbi:MAG: hypothetical protein JSS81_15625 [Acidobacteria bacterium]|nr:hypothetical protein [Acidobacteriota bacterium]
MTKREKNKSFSAFFPKFYKTSQCRRPRKKEKRGEEKQNQAENAAADRVNQDARRVVAAGFSVIFRAAGFLRCRLIPGGVG